MTIRPVERSPFVSVADAANYLGIGRDAMYAMLRAGDVPAVRRGNRWVIHRTELEHYRQHGRTVPLHSPSASPDVETLVGDMVRHIAQGYELTIIIRPRRTER